MHPDTTIFQPKKNIPIPSRNSYLNLLIAQTGKFLNALRWRVFFFKYGDKNKTKQENYGFKSQNSAPIDRDLIPFETDMRKMIKNIKFSHEEPNDLLKKMEKDISNIKKDPRLLDPADKTRNH